MLWVKVLVTVENSAKEVHEWKTGNHFYLKQRINSSKEDTYSSLKQQVDARVTARRNALTWCKLHAHVYKWLDSF